jgi:hypothetical protein
MPIDRQPMNPDALKQLLDELLAPVSKYRHARIVQPEQMCKNVAKGSRSSRLAVLDLGVCHCEDTSSPAK